YFYLISIACSVRTMSRSSLLSNYDISYLFIILLLLFFLFFFFNDTATTEIYTLALHDALPIYLGLDDPRRRRHPDFHRRRRHRRSEEHTSELQSRFDLVCRLLLEKKKKKKKKKIRF